MSFIPVSWEEPSSREKILYDGRPRPFKCLACDGPAPGVHMYSYIIICQHCMETALEFVEFHKCFWCRTEKPCHRFAYIPTGQGGVHMCRDCCEDFLRRISEQKKNRRTRLVLRQGNLLEDAA